MSKSGQNPLNGASRSRTDTRQLAICALLCALDVVLRLVLAMPSLTLRFSIEAVPVILAGYFYGPVSGMMVGFVGDFIGCLFTPYGWDPLLSISPMLIGMFAGLLRPLAYSVKKPWDVWKVILTVLPGKALGSVYWTSQCFIWLGYSKKAMGPLMLSRVLEATVEGVLDSVVVTLLILSGIFARARLFPPAKREGIRTTGQKLRLAGMGLLMVQIIVFVAGSLTIGLDFMNKELSMGIRLGSFALYCIPLYLSLAAMLLSWRADRENQE